MSIRFFDEKNIPRQKKNHKKKNSRKNIRREKTRIKENLDHLQKFYSKKFDRSNEQNKNWLIINNDKVDEIFSSLLDNSF